MTTAGWFDWLAKTSAWATGRPITFLLAAGSIVVWLVTGPFFHFSDTWQLVINTGTTIVTFLMVFLIQNTQNRDTAAMHLKLDELIRAVQGAHNSLIDLENEGEDKIAEMQKTYQQLAVEVRREVEKGVSDEDCPDPTAVAKGMQQAISRR